MFFIYKEKCGWITNNWNSLRKVNKYKRASWNNKRGWFWKFGISIVTLEIINKIRTPFKSPVSYGCSFVAKLSWKKKIIFFEKICFLQNIHYLQVKCFYMEKKKVLYWKLFLLKKTFFTEKNINENVKNIYLISEIYFYTENVCVTNKI